jgi:sugar phosphate isomerase/epimerase
MRLQIGNFSRRLDFEGRVVIGGGLGFDSISLGPDVFDAYLARNATDELKELLQHNGIAVATGALGLAWNMEGALWDEALAKAEPRLKLLAELGGKATFSAPNRWMKAVGEAEWEWLVAKFRAYADWTGRYGVEVVFEFLGPQVGRPDPRRIMYPWVMGLDMALELIERVDRPNLGLILDVIHWWAGGGTYDDLHKVKGLPLTLHVFDLPEGVDPETMADSDRVLPGEGFIDLVRWLRILKDDGYEGDLMPEVLGARAAELAEADSWEGPRLVRDVYRALLRKVEAAG